MSFPSRGRGWRADVLQGNVPSSGHWLHAGCALERCLAAPQGPAALESECVCPSCGSSHRPRWGVSFGRVGLTLMCDVHVVSRGWGRENCNLAGISYVSPQDQCHCGGMSGWRRASLCPAQGDFSLQDTICGSLGYVFAECPYPPGFPRKQFISVPVKTFQ